MNKCHAIALGSFVLAIAVIGCTPDYPNCETDKNCAAKSEFCVAGKCQQCRSPSDCKEGFACSSGRCDKIPGFCQDRSQCPSGQECIASRCGPCGSDKDCTPGSRCWKGACDTQKHCGKDDDCAQNEDCVDGFCTTEKAPAPPPAQCSLEAVFFDFNESALTTEATAALARDSDCLKQVGRAATLVGHTDPRGTQEYNLALSEKRAQSVRDHLGRLGVDGTKLSVLPRGSLDAKGTDEPSWAQDRRVDFNWK